MRTWLFPGHKSGISEMVSYVLLVVIAIGLSVLVYGYLSLQTPKERLECSSDTNLILKGFSCSIAPGVYLEDTDKNELTPPQWTYRAASGKSTLLTDMTLYNKGFHIVQAAYVRVGSESKQVKDLINAESLYLVAGDSPDNNNSVQGLLPGKSIHVRYEYVGDSSQFVPNTNVAVELEPAIGDERRLALCESAVVTQSATCATCGDNLINAPAEDCDYVLSGNTITSHKIPATRPNCAVLFGTSSANYPTKCKLNCRFDENSCKNNP